MTNIGVISDTHGLLRPEAVEALSGSDLILHAGDMGTSAVLEELRRIAPVTAVRGNVDHEAWARKFGHSEALQVEGVSIYMLHILAELDLKPEVAGFGVVVYGLSHVPKSEVSDGVLYFNPGSAGPRRFKLPVTVGRLVVESEAVRGKIIELGLRG
jgi:putative phosphoesterase